MPLFENQKASEAVTPDDVKALTGIKAEDFAFLSDNPELDGLLTKWIEQIGSHISVRLKKTIAPTADEYEAIRDILLRTVAKLVSIAQQQRSSPVVQTGDFAVSILNTSDVTRDLDDELKPFKTRRIGFYSSVPPEATV